MTETAAPVPPGMRIERQREIVGRLLALHEAGETQLADEPLAVPASDFYDPERFVREWHLVFRRQPNAVCVSSDVGRPGDHLAVDVGGVPVLVLRGQDGALRAFLNICRHRGSPLVESPGRQARSFRCRFHGWTYDLEGKLIATPYGDDGFTGLDRDCLGLVPVPVEEAFGLVFVRAEGEEDVNAARWLCGVGEEVGDFRFGQYHAFDVWNSEWPCNWKLLLDTFLESYHVFALHADTVAKYFLVRPSAFEPFGPHLRFHSLQKSLLDLKGTDRASWELLPHGTVEYLITPATVLSHSVDHLALYRFLPLAADRTAVEATIYTPAPVETDRQATHYRRTLELHQRVSGDQDFTQCVKIQRSLETGRIDRVLFGRNEPAAIHFHRCLDYVVGT
jgi:phenylpropionate dioxygenase-like ring-hydroxylating dioxygenase large terminal subunit